MTGSDYRFNTPDMEFSLTLEPAIMDRIFRLCQDSGFLETGGVLVGHYNEGHDNAIVTDISPAPSDSKRGRTSFYRGVRGLQSWLCNMWPGKRLYYLGEWHYHPFSEPTASSTDFAQLKAYAENDALHCPEPVMLIIGGDPKTSWKTKAYVAPRGQSIREMVRAKPSNLTDIAEEHEWTTLA